MAANALGGADAIVSVLTAACVEDVTTTSRLMQVLGQKQLGGFFSGLDSARVGNSPNTDLLPTTEEQIGHSAYRKSIGNL
jgi:hypothetical protein